MRSAAMRQTALGQSTRSTAIRCCTACQNRHCPLPWLSEEDVAYYASQFAASGFRGPLNRYRNHYADHAHLSALEDKRIYQPSLFIGGSEDLVLKMYPGDVVKDMKPHLVGLQAVHILDGCGHWTQQERADEVNVILLDWLAGL